MSAETGLSVAELRGWDWQVPAGVRWLATDPHGPASYDPGDVESREVIRQRIGLEWLAEQLDRTDLPPAVREAAARLSTWTLNQRSAL